MGRAFEAFYELAEAEKDIEFYRRKVREAHGRREQAVEKLGEFFRAADGRAIVFCGRLHRPVWGGARELNLIDVNSEAVAFTGDVDGALDGRAADLFTLDQSALAERAEAREDASKWPVLPEPVADDEDEDSGNGNVIDPSFELNPGIEANGNA